MRSILVALATLALACAPSPGTLELRLLAEGEPTPARVELLDADGKAWISPDALPVLMECLAAPLPEWLLPHARSLELPNPYTGTTQFYLDGTGHVELPPGRYTLRVFKGNEYRVASQGLQVNSGELVRVEIDLERWIDPSDHGWYASDDHLHITRNQKNQNSWLAAWMEAEGLEVASLLQMGTAEQFDVTPQYAFGDAGTHREGEVLLLPGQEHPRTHFLGHTITMGAQEPIDLRESYIVYEGFWRESTRLDGVSGFAHLGQGPAQDGLAISAPGGRIHFIEVLQSEYLQPRILYELLDLGFRIAPSAGTDFPCIPSTPGRERVYVRTEGLPTRASFVEGVRRGRTFVTNGPILELHVGDAGIGDEIRLEGPESIAVSGSAFFDPERDAVQILELVLGGRVVHAVTEPASPGVLRFETDVAVSETTWLALRVSGVKLGETPLIPLEIPDWVQETIDNMASGFDFSGQEEYQALLQPRPSAAHSAAIFIEVPGAQRARVAELAREWVARLDALEARLDPAQIAAIPIWDWLPYSDGVSESHLREMRPTLLEDIARARAHFEQLASRGLFPRAAEDETP